MALTKAFVVALSYVLLSSAAALPKRGVCTSYTLINTRGTSEPQGESSVFVTINQNVKKNLPGGKVYNTTYPAGLDQNSAAATQDIINTVTAGVAANPAACFILEGYSQGAAATINALPSLTGAKFNAVKGVFLLGDPDHRAGLTCNVDNYGGTTTRDTWGVSGGPSPGIPSNWVSKSLDVCKYGDAVCDTTPSHNPSAAIHVSYADDVPTHNLGTYWIVAKLQGN